MVRGLGHGGDGIRGGAVADHLLLVGRDGWITAGDKRFRGKTAAVLAVAALGDWLGEQSLEEGLELWEIDAVLGTLRTGDGRNNRGEIKVEVDAVIDLALAGHAEHSLSLEVILEGAALILSASGGSEKGNRLAVDREDAECGSVFGSHVGDGGAVGEGKRLGALAVELDELADNLGSAEHLGDAQGEVGGGDTLGKLAGEVHADDLGGQECNRLSEHAGLGFDSAHAPTDDAKAVDHSRMGVSAYKAVRVIDTAGVEDAAGQVLKVDLVDDADAGRNYTERLERLLSPLEEFVALAVTLELHVEIQLHRVGPAVVIDLDGVVDDEINGNEGLDDAGLAAEASNGAAHGGEIDKKRYAGKVLEDDTCDHKGDFLGSGGLGVPRGEGLHILLMDLAAITVTEHRLQHHTD